VAGQGDVIVADSRNHCIRKITKTDHATSHGLGWQVSTLAGTGKAGYRNGDHTVAQFRSPHGVAVDGQGSIIVSDTANNCICMLTPQGLW
jgi:hypothetical protein